MDKSSISAGLLSRYITGRFWFSPNNVKCTFLFLLIGRSLFFYYCGPHFLIDVHIFILSPGLSSYFLRGQIYFLPWLSSHFGGVVGVQLGGGGEGGGGGTNLVFSSLLHFLIYRSSVFPRTILQNPFQANLLNIILTESLSAICKGHLKNFSWTDDGFSLTVVFTFLVQDSLHIFLWTGIWFSFQETPHVMDRICGFLSVDYFTFLEWGVVGPIYFFS